MQNLAVATVRPSWQCMREPQILILDDSDFDRKRLRRSFANYPNAINIKEASDLYAFRQLVQSNNFDLILIDYALADGDGIQALRSCKDWNNNKGAYYVMVTGNDCSNLAVTALKSGFDDYVTKNEIDRDILSGILTRAVQENVLEKDQRMSIFSRFKTERANAAPRIVPRRVN